MDTPETTTPFDELPFEKLPFDELPLEELPIEGLGLVELESRMEAEGEAGGVVTVVTQIVTAQW
ncbi:hypothetical protein ABZT47_30940 [Sphaerisporangium sp. NPDC005289]|uniref:hypothetical protein n=1 Tax=Sphaerisporangium sp. NPDC005289 TaxID=3155247 RepID=UPI0033B084E5